MFGIEISAVDLSAGILHDCPYGGVAVVWKKTVVICDLQCLTDFCNYSL